MIKTTKKSFFDDSDDSDMDLFKPIAERKKVCLKTSFFQSVRRKFC